MTVQFYLMQDYLPKALSTPNLCVLFEFGWIGFGFSDLLATAFWLFVTLPHIFVYSSL